MESSVVPIYLKHVSENLTLFQGGESLLNTGGIYGVSGENGFSAKSQIKYRNLLLKSLNMGGI